MILESDSESDSDSDVEDDNTLPDVQELLS
jgi:hypothetical protein